MAKKAKQNKEKVIEAEKDKPLKGFYFPEQDNRKAVTIWAVSKQEAHNIYNS